MSILIQRTIDLGIRIHYRHEVTQLLQEHATTTVEFSNGKRIQPDVIIGADGRMRSITRKYVNGDNKPIYQGFINWVGVIEHGSVNFPELSVADYWGAGERFGIVPVSKSKAYWAAGDAC